MITLTGIICIGFILCGILGILKYTFIQILLGGLFLFFVGNLFYVNLKRKQNNTHETKKNPDNDDRNFL